MRNILAVLAITIMAALISGGCHRTSEASRAMDRAEQLVMSRPDSSLAILNGIDTAGLASDFDRCRFAVLHTMAADKNDLPLTDSLGLQRAIDFFSAGSYPRYQMLAHLYMGRYLFYKELFAPAAINLQRSALLAEDQSDHFHAALSYQAIQMIFRQIHDGKTEVEYSKKAVDEYGLTDFEYHYFFARAAYAEALLNSMQYEESIDSAFSVISDLQSGKETLKDIIPKCFSTIALDYYRLKQYRKAMDFIDSMVCYNAPLGKEDYLVYGSSALRLGDISTAKSANDKILAIDSNYTWLSQSIAILQDDKIAAYDFLRDNMTKRNKIDNLIVTQSVTASLFKAQAENIKLANKLTAKAQQMTLLIGIATLIFIAMTIGIISLYIKRNKEKNQKLRFEIKLLSEELGLKKSVTERESAEAAIASFEEISNSLNLLFKAFANMPSGIKPSSKNYPLYKDLQLLIQQLREGGQLYTRLEAIADKRYDGLITAFKADITPAYHKIFLYLLYNFPTNVIATLLGTDSKAVYNQKARMKQAINNSTSPRKEEYLSLLKR